MALKFGNRVLETATTTGTGAFTLAGAITGYQRFSGVCSTSDTIYYCIYAVDTNGNPSGDWEVGLGTYSGTNTLTRTTVTASTNGGSAVNFGAGTKYVMGTPSATFIASLLTKAAASDVWTGTSEAVGMTPKSLFDSAAVQTLTDGTTITPDFGAGLNFKVTLGGNRTLANPSNAKDGQSGVIRVTQDGTGSRTLAYGSNWRFPGGAATGGVLSTAAGSVDQIAYIVGSSGVIYATLSKAFAA